MKSVEGQNTSIVELFSPPRISKLAKQFGIRAGRALDLTEIDPEDGQPWDFNLERKRLKAMEVIRKKTCPRNRQSHMYVI